ncbi:SAGA-associated factor 73 [Trichoderma lentiforme]|uniref:SAGA-associated factor 73 n=2 Tax=Trichoderma TaxID=5543 RepID=A0A9P4XKM6_9HYPO|nr:SAGA-associated factor 73 [Trichoderma lentiforme]
MARYPDVANWLLVLTLAWAPIRSLGLVIQPYEHRLENEQLVLGQHRPESPSTAYRSQAPYAPPFPSRPGNRPSGFIALGDSYSAGIGTGLFNGTEDDCRHGHNAYPMLVQEDLSRSLDGSEVPTFQFLSCTGSTVNDMLAGAEHSQIDEFNTTATADFALLSIGGNDLGFFEIMNSCIFRFYSFYSGTCESALRHADEQMASSDFEHRLRLVIMEILDHVRWEKRPWFTITVTGYARFFNADTEECDDYSLGMWWRGPKLKRELRQRMNDMVVDVNNKIRRSVDAINAAFAEPRILFVDYDDAFEGHRFCEPGVVEPDYARNETWFFLVGGLDNSETPVLGATDALLPLDSPLIDPVNCLGPAQKSGDWGEMALCMMATAASKDAELRKADGRVVAENSMWYVPTYYGKTFHPVASKKDSKNATIKLKKSVPKHSKPGNWMDGSVIDEEKKKTNNSSPSVPVSPGPVVNQLDDLSRETFATGRPLEDNPELQQCKHCKKSILKTAAKAHIAQCLKVKKEKAQRKKEAREARERAKEAAREEEAKKNDDDNADGKDEDSDAEEEKKAGKKAASKKPEVSKKRKADADADKGPKAKKKKDEPKAKLPKPKGPVDVERQCGVILPNGQPCARSLTCKSHSMGAKRAVSGRSLPYDMLLAAYQKKNQAKQQKAALDANAPLEDDDDANNGPVDSDEETGAVMSALAHWNPQPLIPQPVFTPIKRQYQLARLHEQLQMATNGGRTNIFKVTGFGAQRLPPGHPGLLDNEDAPGEPDVESMSIPGSARQASFGMPAPPQRQASVASRA